MGIQTILNEMAIELLPEICQLRNNLENSYYVNQLNSIAIRLINNSKPALCDSS